MQYLNDLCFNADARRKTTKLTLVVGIGIIFSGCGGLAKVQPALAKKPSECPNEASTEYKTCFHILVTTKDNGTYQIEQELPDTGVKTKSSKVEKNTDKDLRWYIDNSSAPAGVSDCKFVGNFNSNDSADSTRPWYITKVLISNDQGANSAFKPNQMKLDPHDKVPDTKIIVKDHNKQIDKIPDKFEYQIRVQCKFDKEIREIKFDPELINEG